MAAKYPSFSPYAYCSWNPVKHIDPSGEEVEYNDDGWKIDKKTKPLQELILMVEITHNLWKVMATG